MHSIDFLTGFRSTRSSGWMVGVLLVLFPFLLGAEEGYLREIEAEAKRQATLSGSLPPLTRIPAEGGTTPGGETAVEHLAANLDSAAFEQALREALPGTYALYQQFDPSRKQQVYAAYLQDRRLTAISEKVIQLLSVK